jgi:hypothetical protein
MPLPAAEHARVQRESRAFRNACGRQHLRAYGEAKAWCDHFGATIRRDAYPGGLLFTVTLPGFWPGQGKTLPLAVQGLAFNVVTRARSGATHAPRGAKLDAVRAALEHWDGRRAR